MLDCVHSNRGQSSVESFVVSNEAPLSQLTSNLLPMRPVCYLPERHRYGAAHIFQINLQVRRQYILAKSGK